MMNVDPSPSEKKPDAFGRIVMVLLIVTALTHQVLNGIPQATWPMVRSLLLVTLYLLAARRAGLWLGGLLGGKVPLALSLLLGTGVISFWPILIGSFGALHPGLAAAPLFLLACCANPVRMVHSLSDALRRGRVVLERAGAESPGLFLVLIFALGLAFLAVLAPPCGTDALTYHLGLPGQYLLRASVIPPDTLAYYFYWQCHEMAIIPLLALDSSGQAVNLLGFFFLLILADGIRRLATQWGDERAGLLAAVTALTSPIVLLTLVHTKNDLLSAAFLIWAFVEQGASGLKGPEMRFGLRRAFLLGGALAVKPTNIVIVLPALMLEADFFRRSWKRAGPYAAALCLLPAYWVIRNFILVGEPFSPEMIRFADPPGQTVFGLVLGRLEHLARSFFTGISKNMDGPVGPMILVLAFGAFLGLKNSVSRRRIAWIGAVGILLWLVLGFRQSRFLLPLYLLLVASGAAYLGTRGRILRSALLIAAIISLGAGGRILHVNNRFLSFQTGRETVEQYMERWLNSYRLQQWGNDHLPRDANIISVGETRFFPLKRRVTFDGYWQNIRVLDWAHETHSATRLATRLGDHGYSHLMLNQLAFLANIASGSAPRPRCERDLAVLHAMLGDSALATPLWLDLREPGLGFYALSPGPPSP